MRFIADDWQQADVCRCAGLETSVTRTPLASTLILSILAGSSTILVPCLASALVALYITLDFPFIMSQRDRADMALKVSPCPRSPPETAMPTVDVQWVIALQQDAWQALTWW